MSEDEKFFKALILLATDIAINWVYDNRTPGILGCGVCNLQESRSIHYFNMFT